MWIMNYRPRLLRDVMVLDAIVVLAIAAQLILIPALAGWVVQDTLPLGIALAGLGIFFLTCAVNHDRFPVAAIMVFLLPACAFLFFYFHAHFTGPHDALATAFFLAMMAFNGAGFVVDIHMIATPAVNLLLKRPEAGRGMSHKYIAIIAILVAPAFLFIG
jgi:hypothetical protein